MTPPAAERSGPPLVHDVGTPGLAATLRDVTLVAIALLSWMLNHSYQGIFHDARLYTLQALSRLHPESLPHDVFLAFGSQDRFTVFSPLYASVIFLMGVDKAAATLTLASQVVLLLAAYLVARTVLPRWAALCGTTLVVALPNFYGHERIFQCIEPFLTPRMLSEAMVLGSMGCAWRGQRVRSVLLMIAAACFHPIIALAGIAAYAAALLLHLAGKVRIVVLVAGAAICLGAALLGFHFVAGRFDAAWLQIVRDRSPYLFVSNWNSDDLSRVGLVSLTLLSGLLTLPGRLKTACFLGLFTTLVGVALTFLTADLLHLVLPTQLQWWRWQWLGMIGTALLLPYLLHFLWRRSLQARAAALVVTSAWIFRDGSPAITAMICAVVLLVMPVADNRKCRLFVLGAWAMLTLAAIWRIADNLEFTDLHYLNAALPLTLRRTISFAKDGTAIGAIMAGSMLAARWTGGAVWVLAILVATLTGCVLVSPFSREDWLVHPYPEELVERFEVWREIIPPEAQVLWNDSPLSAWILLQRSHYLSAAQSAGVVFSRAQAMELKLRAEALRSVISPQVFLQWTATGPTVPMSAEQLKNVCGLGVANFLITTADLGMPPVATIHHDGAPAYELKLYSCQKRAAAAAT